MNQCECCDYEYITPKTALIRDIKAMLENGLSDEYIQARMFSTYSNHFSIGEIDKIINDLK